MKTTLSKILSFGPCNQIGRADDGGWLLAMETLKRAGLKYDPNMKVTIQQIYESNGIKDAIWCLRCFDYKEYCLFLAAIAESVYHIYKKHNPHDHVIWGCIQGIHYYYHGFITRNELKKRAEAAAGAAGAAWAAAQTARATWDAAGAAARAAYSADNAAGAAYSAAQTAARDAAWAAWSAARGATAWDEKWNEIEKLFKKTFYAK